jgi:hypothetical protein
MGLGNENRQHLARGLSLRDRRAACALGGSVHRQFASVVPRTWAEDHTRGSESLDEIEEDSLRETTIEMQS